MKNATQLVKDMISPSKKIETPTIIRPEGHRWIECPKCHGMPNQAYDGHCKDCNDSGVKRV